MTDFIGGSLLRWMAKPYAAAGKIGLRAFSFTASPFLKIADRVLGSQVLEDLSALVHGLPEPLRGLQGARGRRPRSCCPRDQTGFVVVTTLEGPPLEEAGFFIDRLVDERLHLAGVVANKVVPLELRRRRPGRGDRCGRTGQRHVACSRETRRAAIADARAALETFTIARDAATSATSTSSSTGRSTAWPTSRC